MLTEISVKNFAIIEDVTVNFDKNMTVLTGQTGAGKSLIIDAIGLVLGARADLDMIRYGEKESIVSATFDNLCEDAINLLDSYGIKVNNTLTITRCITNSGKNTIKVNETNVTLQQLKQIGLFIGDIHVQHDTYRLINKDNYLSFLDDFKNKDFLKCYNNYQLKRVKYLDAINKYKDCVNKNKDINSKLEFLEFQYNELKELDLEEDIDVKLASEIEKLSNFDKIYTNLNEAYVHLDDDGFGIDELYEAADKLKKISAFDQMYQDNSEQLFEAYYQILDIKSALYKAKNNLDFDPEYLDELNSRLFEINKVKDKYKMSVNELISYIDEIGLQISLITNYDETISVLKKDIVDTFDELVKAAVKLREYRMKEAKKCETDIIKECRSLDLENTRFEIIFNEADLSDEFNSSVFLETGIDVIEFNISFNVGEPPKPLSKVASGGELSRVMLAFKTNYLKKNPLSFMVFDEIDSGVSGVTARKIASKMREISEHVQVLAITHLPQVAAIAHRHLFISKNEENNRTKTLVEELSYERRITEIAVMLSGLELSPSILQTAKAMIDSYNK